jgi:chromosomal replication initiation ATPase DnaA
MRKLFMSLNLQSQNVINQLLDAKKIASGNLQIGPLTPSEELLLRVILEEKNSISNKTGEALASFVRSSYLNAKEKEEKSDKSNTKDELEPSVEDDIEILKKRSYLLAELTCRSFRGIAPAGEEITFSFDTKSNLIYGPNGSGKTSLLGAVIWVLTGSAMQ